MDGFFFSITLSLLLYLVNKFKIQIDFFLFCQTIAGQNGQCQNRPNQIHIDIWTEFVTLCEWRIEYNKNKSQHSLFFLPYYTLNVRMHRNSLCLFFYQRFPLLRSIFKNQETQRRWWVNFRFADQLNNQWANVYRFKLIKNAHAQIEFRNLIASSAKSIFFSSSPNTFATSTTTISTTVLWLCVREHFACMRVAMDSVHVQIMFHVYSAWYNTTPTVVRLLWNLRACMCMSVHRCVDVCVFVLEFLILPRQICALLPNSCRTRRSTLQVAALSLLLNNFSIQQMHRIEWQLNGRDYW